MVWSPDSKFISFATFDNKIKIFDSLGNYVNDIKISSDINLNQSIVGLEW